MADPQHANAKDDNIVNILDKDIKPHSNPPKFEKVSVKAHCKRCNIEVFTRVDIGVTQDCERIAECCCYYSCWCLVAACLQCETSPQGGSSLNNYVTQKVYQHSCPQCHTVIGEFHTKI